MKDLNNKTSAIPVTLQELHWIISSHHLPLYSNIPAIQFHSYHNLCSFSLSNTFTFVLYRLPKRLQKTPVTILHLFTTELKGNDSTTLVRKVGPKKCMHFFWVPSGSIIHWCVIPPLSPALSPLTTLVHLFSDLCMPSHPPADRNILTMQLRGLLAFTMLIFSFWNRTASLASNQMLPGLKLPWKENTPCTNVTKIRGGLFFFFPFYSGFLKIRFLYIFHKAIFSFLKIPDVILKVIYSLLCFILASKYGAGKYPMT